MLGSGYWGWLRVFLMLFILLLFIYNIEPRHKLQKWRDIIIIRIEMFVPHPSLIIIIYWVISEISKYISVYVIRITDYRSENHRCHLYFYISVDSLKLYTAFPFLTHMTFIRDSSQWVLLNLSLNESEVFSSLSLVLCYQLLFPPSQDKYSSPFDALIFRTTICETLQAVFT